MANKKQAVEAFDGMTIAAHVDAQGNIHIDAPVKLPAGEVWLTLGFVSPEALDEDDALWEAALASDPEKLERLTAEARQSRIDGTAIELNIDDLMP